MTPARTPDGAAGSASAPTPKAPKRMQAAPNEHDSRLRSAKATDAVASSKEDAFKLRMRRIESWMERAERSSDDQDLGFLSYWIAFNACYATDKKSRPTLAAIGGYLRRLVDLDRNGVIHEAIYDRFSIEIRTVVDNTFLLEQFWDPKKGWSAGADGTWNEKFTGEQQRVHKALERALASRSSGVLVVLFERLYTLRNQLVHGGATWGSQANRLSVKSGARIMAALLPIFVGIMRENRDEDWGSPPYHGGLWKGRIRN